MIIIGPPASGKTTLLKDMCRSLGSRYRISVIDERGEIGAVYHGVPQNSIGAMTDVFDGYPKAEGITAAVRVMSPQIVMCDELGGSEDCDAVSRSVNSGVKIIASAHGFSPEDAFRQNGLESLVRKGIFEYAAVLKGEENPGKIEYIKKAADLI
jgi:stage III sporulation protein AA